MARSGRPKTRVANFPAVNDNQPGDSQPGNDQPLGDQSDAHAHGDDCRDALMAMPDVSALDFTAQFIMRKDGCRGWSSGIGGRSSRTGTLIA